MMAILVSLLTVLVGILLFASFGFSFGTFAVWVLIVFAVLIIMGLSLEAEDRR